MTKKVIIIRFVIKFNRKYFKSISKMIKIYQTGPYDYLSSK